MTFLELQKKIVQTRKNRKGVKNRVDYFANDANESFYMYLYKKALNAANQIVKHCDEKGEIEPFSIVFGKHEKRKSNDDKKYLDALKMAADYEREWKKTSKQNSELISENLQLMEKIRKLESDLAKTKNGGRFKDKEKEADIIVYKHANPKATVREIAAALGVSKTTVQKTLVEHNLNNSRKK